MMFRPLLMLSCGSVEVSHGKIRVRQEIVYMAKAMTEYRKAG